MRGQKIEWTELYYWNKYGERKKLGVKMLVVNLGY